MSDDEANVDVLADEVWAKSAGDWAVAVGAVPQVASAAPPLPKSAGKAPAPAMSALTQQGLASAKGGADEPAVTSSKKRKRHRSKGRSAQPPHEVRAESD